MDPRKRILLPSQHGTLTPGLDCKDQQVRDTSDDEPLKAAILAAIADKLTHLILMPKDKITSDLSLSNIGMDSMLAAEFSSAEEFARFLDEHGGSDPRSPI